MTRFFVMPMDVLKLELQAKYTRIGGVTHFRWYMVAVRAAECRRLSWYVFAARVAAAKEVVCTRRW